MSRYRLILMLISLALVAGFASGIGADRAEGKPHGTPEYIALGDEIAIGAGLADPDESYVSLFQRFLESPHGLNANTTVMNLAGDNQGIFDVLGSQVSIALAEIETRRSDTDKKNDVGVVTIDVGLVDLFGGLIVCSEEGSPEGCASFFNEVLTWHELFMNWALDDLRTAGGPNLHIIVMTNYNPFLNTGCYFNSLAPAWDAALEGGLQFGVGEGMNDITRRLASVYGVRVADIYGLLGPEQLPAMCDTDGPNAEGHALIANEFAKAFGGKKSH